MDGLWQLTLRQGMVGHHMAVLYLTFSLLPYSPLLSTLVSASEDSYTCFKDNNDPASLVAQSLQETISKASCELGDDSHYPPHYSPNDGEEFDMIIVGAGSAGSVVASRLSEVTDWRILLLEAGENPPKRSEIPAFVGSLQKTDMDWKYRTEPDGRMCLGMKDTRCDWPRGKALGGSSALNYMLYVRGNAKDYDGWASEGSAGWGYEDVLPYFKKSEDMRAKEVLEMPDFQKYHGTNGYLKVESFNRDGVEELGEMLREGMEEMGYELNIDCNGKSQRGFVPTQGTLQDGKRCSTAKAFLTPAKLRNNLKVSKRSTVTKILIRDKEAYGVEFINGLNEKVTVLSKKEVVVSAGSINSPQILMLSGIGPKKHLGDLNIMVVADLPVGRNLQDHPMMAGLVLSFNYSKPFERAEDSMYNFLVKGKGTFSGIRMTSYAAFINTIEGIDYPDISILMVDYSKNESSNLVSLLEGFGCTDEIRSNFVNILRSHNIILFLCLLRPYSRGSIELKSSDPLDHPKIQPGYFTDRRDMDTYLRTYEFLYKLVETNGLKRGDAQLHAIHPPGCSGFDTESTQYRECSLRHLTTSTYHPTSTCKMGPASSPESVVDSDLRVKGIKGLRVIDASIMPNIVSGNTNAAVIMIGEKGADLIKETWLNTKSETSAA